MAGLPKYELNTLGLTLKSHRCSWFLYFHHIEIGYIQSRFLPFPNQKKDLTIIGEGRKRGVSSHINVMFILFRPDDVGRCRVHTFFPLVFSTPVPLRRLIQKVPLTQTISGTPPSNWVPQEGILGFETRWVWQSRPQTPSSMPLKKGCKVFLFQVVVVVLGGWVPGSKLELFFEHADLWGWR